jgi:hypothetical protein
MNAKTGGSTFAEPPVVFRSAAAYSAASAE